MDRAALLQQTMKKQKIRPRQLAVRYSVASHGWVIDGDAGRPIVFATKMAAEDYCIQKLHQHPVERPACYQELPRVSVWTGAPWDHYFAKFQ